ncbi:MAG TPA: transglutaminase family protein [Hydrogenophaga sp.]|uniref:transglutaminase family protein n=1 Tax=Hydrogenophaga sp. TaxID=1904254 RepID=UPI002B9560D5|nr:transglutaminase family protein [Hydrogenophaga sp.]HMN93218.1 transglutaminase family protein [Hydrogenophaga sp.]HMP11108.1 transglutaminase family protein [Hydrogenophaga sp.]
MRLSVRHTTRYTYTEPLLYSVQTLHLWPVSGAAQTVQGWDVRTPAPLHAQPDGQGNRVHSYSLVARPEQDLREQVIDARGVVQTLGVAVVTDTGRTPPPAFYLRSTPLAEPHPRMAVWARANVPGLAEEPEGGEGPSLASLVALASAVADKVAYRKGSTSVETTALEAFDWGLGVCQDQAHVMVAVCRSIGWPARYVSGYFYAANEPELASHAWVDVCIDVAERRWLSLDVTHRCPTDERHIRVAAATDYAACLPVKGLRRGGGRERLEVEIRIEPLSA